MIHSIFKSAVESVMPDPNGDYLESHGTLSPEQFIHCGDILTKKCNSWMWDSGKPENKFAFLPDDKQFLYTTNILSTRIIKKQEYLEHTITEDDIDDNWTVTTHSNIHKTTSQPSVQNTISNDNIDEYEDDIDIDIEEPDESMLSIDNDIHTRKYDIYITYDKYYQTPRLWLFGYNYDNMPLGFKEIMEDIQTEYINKTVTYENHPHLPLLLVSIHPCRHAKVMKKLMKNYKNIENKLDNYLFIFLKFLSSIIPNINYDHTFEHF